ncbi:MAG TPA: hypothetical protein VF590_17930 [Isosphaeraceae bacterium]|jgi:hypothetical protein
MTGPSGRRRLDALAAAMAVVTLGALAAAAWLRFGPAPAASTPAVGAVAPPLRLLDPDSGEPVVLLGLRGRVVWVTFWAARSPSGPAVLKALDGIWGRSRARSRFTMVAAAVDADDPAPVRAAVSEAGVDVPVFLASPETRRAFGAGDGVLHVVIDEVGRVTAIASGMAEETLSRLSDLVGRRLDDLEPFGGRRFAAGARGGIPRGHRL